MDIGSIQEIRNVKQPDKFKLLVELICGDGASERSGSVIQAQAALHKLERFRFSVGSGYHMTVISPDDTKKPTRKVIITEDEFGGVIKKEREADVYAYDFLRDYLGLDGSKPFSEAEMLRKYPQITKKDGVTDSDWYGTICRMLLKGAKRQIYGPGKKAF